MICEETSHARGKICGEGFEPEARRTLAIASFCYPFTLILFSSLFLGGEGLLAESTTGLQSERNAETILSSFIYSRHAMIQ